MAEDPNPPVTVTDPPGTSGAAGAGNESTPTAGLSLEAINKATGRQYKTIEDALSGVGETYRHVGQPPRVVEKVVEKLPENVVTREEFEKSEFFRSNAEANKHKSLLEQLAKGNGMTVQEIFAGDPEKNPIAKFFKETAAKLTVADEAANARSALTSDPRLGIISDDSTKAKEAFEASQKARASGDMLTADRLQKEAEKSALDAVIKHAGLEGKGIVD
jgi:hypothetical protein